MFQLNKLPVKLYFIITLPVKKVCNLLRISFCFFVFVDDTVHMGYLPTTTRLHTVCVAILTYVAGCTRCGRISSLLPSGWLLAVRIDWSRFGFVGCWCIQVAAAAVASGFGFHVRCEAFKCIPTATSEGVCQSDDSSLAVAIFPPSWTCDLAGDWKRRDFVIWATSFDLLQCAAVIHLVLLVAVTLSHNSPANRLFRHVDNAFYAFISANQLDY